MSLLQLSMRENDLIEVPRELGQLTRLRELHLQGNRLVVLPPEIGNDSIVQNYFFLSSSPTVASPALNSVLHPYPWHL